LRRDLRRDGKTNAMFKREGETGRQKAGRAGFVRGKAFRVNGRPIDSRLKINPLKFEISNLRFQIQTQTPVQLLESRTETNPLKRNPAFKPNFATQLSRLVS